MKTATLNLRAALVSLLIFFVFIGAWQLSTTGPSIGGSSAGAVSGIMNMGCQIGGMVTASLTPFVATAFGWTPSFDVAAAVCVVGGVTWLFIDPHHVLSTRSVPVSA